MNSGLGGSFQRCGDSSGTWSRGLHPFENISRSELSNVPLKNRMTNGSDMLQQQERQRIVHHHHQQQQQQQPLLPNLSNNLTVHSIPTTIPTPQQLYTLMNQVLVAPSLRQPLQPNPESIRQAASYYHNNRIKSQESQPSPEAVVYDLSVPKLSEKSDHSVDLSNSDHATFGTLPSPSTDSSPNADRNTNPNVTPTTIQQVTSNCYPIKIEQTNASVNDSSGHVINRRLNYDSHSNRQVGCNADHNPTMIQSADTAHAFINENIFTHNKLENENSIETIQNWIARHHHLLRSHSTGGIQSPEQLLAMLRKSSLENYYQGFVQNQIYQQLYEKYLQFLNNKVSVHNNQELSRLKTTSTSGAPQNLLFPKSMNNLGNCFKPQTPPQSTPFKRITQTSAILQEIKNENKILEPPARHIPIVQSAGQFQPNIVSDHPKIANVVCPTQVNSIVPVSIKPTGTIYSCKLCPKTYAQASALKMHVRTHTLPCRCSHCGKSFSRKWLLKGHERTHTGERPYSCTVCGRSFADRSNLRAHMQTHQRDKRYICSSCPRSFSRMGLLNKHMVQCSAVAAATPSNTGLCRR